MAGQHCPCSLMLRCQNLPCCREGLGDLEQAPCSALSRVRLGDGPISAERPRVPSFMNTSASNPHSNSKDSIIVPILQARKLRHQEIRILAQVQSIVSGRSVQP